MKVAFSLHSDIGLVRQNQEDNGIILIKNPLGITSPSDHAEIVDCALVVVADGMGGASYGEVASKLTVESMQYDFIHKQINTDTVYNFLNDSIKLADQRIKESNASEQNLSMGTTVVAVVLINDVAYVAWVGDSRCYRWNEQKGLLPLTQDHSFVRKLVEEQQITMEQAINHPYKHIITKSLGAEDASPDITIHGFKEGDILLLCSDGLNTMVDEMAITEVLASDNSLKEKGKILIELAKKGGGADNVTVALAAYEEKQSSMVSMPIIESPKRENAASENKKVKASSYNFTRLLLPLFVLIITAFVLKYALFNSHNKNKANAISLSQTIDSLPKEITPFEKKEELLLTKFDTSAVEKKDIEGKNYSIRIDAYTNEKDAQHELQIFKSKHSNRKISLEKNKDNLYELIVYDFQTKGDAQKFINTAKLENAIILYIGEINK
jgi:protein phosphatase